MWKINTPYRFWSTRSKTRKSFMACASTGLFNFHITSIKIRNVSSIG